MVGTAAALLIAGVVLYAALSLPGITPQGLLLGAGIPLIAMMSWTKPLPPYDVWTATAIVTVAAIVWTYPWWRGSREALRLGGFWLVAALWLLGAVSALLLGNASVLAGRLAYGGFAIVVALLVFQAARRRGRDISIGIAVGLMICHALLLAVGAPYVFETGTHHVTSDQAWARAQGDRFWGGPWLTYHPNLIAMTALLVAIRIGADPKFAPWQRWTAVGNGALLLWIADSRTSLLMAGVASVTYGLLHVWRHGRRALGHALIPVAIALLVFTASGGADNLLKDRYHREAPRREVSRSLSGRVGIWELILDDFRGDTPVEQALGNTDTVRGDILRHKDPRHPRYDTQPRLGGHNVFLGALRRGGVIGLLAVVASLGLVLWRTARRDAPIWIPVVTLAGAASLFSEDELGTTSPLWLMLLAAEVWLYARARSPCRAGAPRSDPANSAALNRCSTVDAQAINRPRTSAAGRSAGLVPRQRRRWHGVRR